MTKPLYVVGHKNPDCDSICSAIAYANLKRQLGYNAIACRLSQCNSETKYILKRFGFDEPTLIHSAKCTLKEIEIDDALLVTKDVTMKEALDKILQRKNKGVFVVDEKQKLLGIVSISNLTSLWTANEKELISLMSKVKLHDVVKTLNAEILNDVDNFKTNGQVHLMASLANNATIYPNSIVIVGNSVEVQRFVIDSKAAMVIICGENWVDNVTLEKAKENNVVILHTPLSALACSQLIYQSPSIEDVMVSNVIHFKSYETVEETSNRMAKTRFRTYPVVDESDRVIGAVSRYHLFNYEKKRYVLVDHNEYSQSVNDLEFGEVVEIVDHHRLGGIETVNPINISSKIVGCTCTIIAEMYKQNKVKITKELAGLLLGAIISDTLNLKSPTTTQLDKDMSKMLCDICECNMDELSKEMIINSDSILNKSHIELLYDDFKEFRIGESRIAIGQSQCKSYDEYMAIRNDFLTYLDETCITQNYDLILIMFTDPMGTGSYFLCTGKKAWVVKEGFKDVLVDEFAPNVISRKKQVLPIIIDTLNK